MGGVGSAFFAPCSSKTRPPWPNLWFIMVDKKVWGGVLFIIVSGELSQLWESIFRAKGVYDVSWYKMYHHQTQMGSPGPSRRVWKGKEANSSAAAIPLTCRGIS